MPVCCRVRRVAVLLTCLLGGLGCRGSSNATTSEEAPAANQINIAVYSGGTQGPISGPLHYWKDKWQEETGAKLNIVEIPYAQLYERIMADVRTGGGEFDGVIAPAFMYGDFIEKEYIVPIKQFQTDITPQWTEDSVVAPVANLLQWDKAWYGCPYDGDAQILYYRKDVLTDPENAKLYEEKTGKPLIIPPKTWDDVAEIAEFFSKGVDWNGNGKPDDHGFAMHLKAGGQGYWNYLSLSAAYVVNPGPKITPHNNVYAFDPETMEPIVNSPGHVRGLEMVRRLAATGEKAQTAWGLEEAWARFLSGNALFCLSFGDLGRMAQDPQRSKVQGKLGCCAAPGASNIWSRKDNDWKELTVPNRIGNTSGASWHGVICKNGKNQALVYHLFAFQANRLVSMFNIGQGWSGIDPSRTFQFVQPLGAATLEDYTRYGFDKSDIQEYSAAFYDNYYRSKATQEYLRIPGASRFYTALDEELSLAMADSNIPAQQAMDNVAEKWRAIVKDLDRELGPGRLKALYKISIGYPVEEK